MQHNKNKIKINPTEHIEIINNTSSNTKNIKYKQQSSIASLKVRNPSNITNIFTQSGVFLDFRISSAFDKIDTINDIIINMVLSAQLNSRRDTASDNNYIVPGVLINSNWLVDRVEFYTSGVLFDIQHAENLFIENCYKSNNELETEKDGGGYNSNYTEFGNNINSIIFPANNTYIPNLSPPTIDQLTVSNINRTLRLGHNLLNKIILKAINDEITIRIYFNTFNEINVNSYSNLNKLSMTNCNLMLQGIKMSSLHLQKELVEKYYGKEYTFTSISRKYNSINFSNVKQGIKISADIGNFSGTFNTFGVYLNYQNIKGENYNQRTNTDGVIFNGITPNRIPSPNDYKSVAIPISNGLSYLVDNKQSFNPYYNQTPGIFEMDITLQDGNGDSYPYDRNLSTLIIKNFSVNNNYSDFTKSFYIYPFNFGSHPNKDYWNQTITSGHYVFDNSSTLIFTPLNDNVPLECQLITLGTQLCQVAVKNGRIFFKLL